jgi:hypothetical protein
MKSRQFNSGFCVFVCLLLMHGTVQANVKGRVKASMQEKETYWVGQQLQLNLDLLTTGYSFSDVQFNLPELEGAFLMQMDSNTIKMSENLNGETWQSIRYPLTIFAHKPGPIQIPPVKVRFSSASIFGAEPRQFMLQTQTVSLYATMPPGAHAGDLVVSTSSFELEYKWQPALSQLQLLEGVEAEKYELSPGDAISLSISRRAGSISGMLLTPIPVFEVEGLSAYPQSADIDDKVNLIASGIGSFLQ